MEQLPTGQIDVHNRPPISTYLIERSIRISYIQSVLSSIFVALTSGMFIIGYALKLGASNAQIGLMTTIPMLCVVAQLGAAMVIERGVSRRALTMWACAISVFLWIGVAAIPYVFGSSAGVKVTALIGLLTLITFVAHLAANARSSWLGDLIPQESRGTFFGRSAMYASIVGMLFSIIGGKFLDLAKKSGVQAFSWLFLISVAIGLINAFLHAPQADVPRIKHEFGNKAHKIIMETLRNKNLMRVTAFAVVWSMQSIAGPFSPTYLLRDMHCSYLGFGILTSASALAMLISSPFWGRMIDRFGCRPVLIVTTTVLVPLPLGWIWITTAKMAYIILIPVNLLAGFAVAGVSVALSSLVFNVTPSAGRSMQLAVYSVIVTLLTAPLPAIGGHLPGWLNALGLHTDLRCTFYICIIFLLSCVFIATGISETDSQSAGRLVRKLSEPFSWSKPEK